MLAIVAAVASIWSGTAAAPGGAGLAERPAVVWADGMETRRGLWASGFLAVLASWTFARGGGFGRPG